MQKQPPYMFYKNRCSWKFRLTPATLLKKRIWHRCFPVNFVKFLRTPFLQNTSGRMLLKMFQNRNGKDKIYCYQKFQLKVVKIIMLSKSHYCLFLWRRAKNFLNKIVFFYFVIIIARQKMYIASTAKKYARIQVFTDPHSAVRFCPFAGEYGSVKTRVLVYFSIDRLSPAMTTRAYDYFLPQTIALINVNPSVPDVY